MDPKPDRESIIKLQSGEIEALGDLYDRHRQLVFRTALGITGDPEMAADLLQEVFLRLYRFMERIDPKRPIEPWLYRITVNLSYTWLKRRNRWGRLLSEMADRFIRDRRPDPPHRITEQNETWGWIRQAILALPIHQRVVVILYYVNDFSLGEIGEILDVPEGTVKSRLHYGRQTLKKKLGVHHDALFEALYDFT